MKRHLLFTAFLVSLLLPGFPALANVTGIVRGVQQNPIAGALVTFTSESNPALSFSGYTSAGGWYDIAISTLAVGDVIPAPFTLDQNHPNPFNPTTTITFSTAEPGVITLSVYNLLGQRVRTLVSGTVPAGEHAAVWDGRDDAGTPSGAGVYLYRLTGGGRVEVKKMLLLDGGSASGWSAPSFAPPALKPAAVTWTVTITGDEIEPREMNGLEIADGGTYDFYVIFMGTLMNFHLVQIPGGTFAMSDTLIERQFGHMVHQVTLSDFEMSAYETTNAQYAQFLNEALAIGEIEMIEGDPYGKGGEWDGKCFADLDTEYSDPDDAIRYALHECLVMYENGSFKVEVAEYRNWPVNHVSWYGAKAFAIHYGLDLPTEAEWEFAAGGGVLEYQYATENGMIDETTANYYQGALGHVFEVGSYPPNPFDLYDMSGNISEWCNDWMGQFTRNPPLTNPAGPITGEFKVFRGGYYGNAAFWCQTFYRGFMSPNFEHYSIGFRVVRRPQPAEKGVSR